MPVGAIGWQAGSWWALKAQYESPSGSEAGGGCFRTVRPIVDYWSSLLMKMPIGPIQGFLTETAARPTPGYGADSEW